MRLTQSLKQRPTVSPQLVLANQLLQFTALELEQAVAQELAENPALELRQVERCPVCGADMEDGRCPACREDRALRDDPWLDRSEKPIDFDEYADFSDYAEYAPRPPSPGNGASDGWDDPMSRLPSTTSLEEHLLAQARLQLAPTDVAAARHLIGSLDERGFLSMDLDVLADDVGAERAHIEEILAVVQSLEPAGIGARNARECLLIQLRDVSGASRERAVAERLVRDQWDGLGRSSLSNLADEAEASVDEVRGALRFVRENLNPFPAHACWAQERRGPAPDKAVCPEPDVIIGEDDSAPDGYRIELPKAGRYRFRICRATGEGAGPGRNGEGAWKEWDALCGRARLFARSIQQRWETLYTLMRCLVGVQRDFLERGERGLKPLTRAEVAEMIDVHESTVSRAVAGKYVELPGRRIVPLETFFDSAAPLKCMIRELIEHEESSLSDQAIAERLAEKGYDVARRTVAKYRNALNILPSSLRDRDRELRT